MFSTLKQKFKDFKKDLRLSFTKLSILKILYKVVPNLLTSK
jgi:hypothetical protein